jgi:predicted phosphodiesterase
MFLPVSIEDDLDNLLKTSKEPLESPTTRQREGDWKAGVVWNGAEGTVTTTAIPAEEIPNWDSILRIWGLDPTKFAVVEPVLFNVWGDPLGTLNRQWKGKVVEIAKASNEDLTELENEIKKHKPKVKVQALGDGAFCVVLADWQIAKPDGDGLKGTLHRILAGIDSVELRIKELRKLKRPIGRLVVLWTGDSIEGCVGHYAQQTYGIELDRRDQIKVARRLLRDALIRWSAYFPEVSVMAVAGNHGENRNSAGKSYTSLNDNDDLAVVEQVAEILEANPEAYGHIKFAIPTDKLSLTLEVAGWVLGITHGHAARASGATPEAKLRRWLEGQALGRRSVGDSDVLVSGHYHHLRVADWGGCVWLQAPAMDGGSDWWEQMKGERSQAGVLTFAMYPEKRVADLEIL